MALIKCCKGCVDRRPACHDTCERYIKEKTESLEAKIRQQKNCQLEYDIHALKKKRKR